MHAADQPPPTLAERQLPRRVREILQQVLAYAANELGRGLDIALGNYEQSLFLHSEQAHSDVVRTHYIRALKELRRGHNDLLQAFRAGLEGALAELRSAPPAVRHSEGPVKAPALSLSLLADIEVEENIVINDICNRAENRSGLPLLLLGQRFAVLAGRPAYDAENMPLGPRMLCEILQTASNTLDISSEYRQPLFKHFDRECMQRAADFYESLNNVLIEQRVLPTLTFVPFRARPTVQNAKPAQPEEPTAAELGLEIVPHTGRPDGASQPPLATAAELAGLAALLNQPSESVHPATRWPGQPDQASTAAALSEDAKLFGLLSDLMGSRRALVGKLSGGSLGNAISSRIADPYELQLALTKLQAQRKRTPAGPENSRSLKMDVLAQLRQLANGEAIALASDDRDAIELAGLLLEHLLRELSPDSVAAPLLGRLQLPLLRTALADKGFFTRQQHPARQFLNAVAEASQYIEPDDASDRQTLDKMRSLVDQAYAEYDGDATLFARLLADLNQHLQTKARRAEVAERRHVEAARGKEKLERARLQAAETLDALLAGKRVPRFLRTLLGQAWSDVLALALLRHGGESEVYQQQLQIAQRLIEAAMARRAGGASPIDMNERQQLRDAIEAALKRVGYHDQDAQALSARLLTASEEEEDDAASSTELAMQLKLRIRFGQDIDEAASDASSATLNAAEKATLQRIQTLPVGTWFEFDADSRRERRRLSWYSTATGQCLFLNHRGQRVGEHSLSWLAREVQHGKVRIVMEDSGTLVDRAWSAIISALQSFAPGEEAK